MLKLLHFTSILHFIKINPSQGLNGPSFSFGPFLKKEVEKKFHKQPKRLQKQSNP